VLSGRGLCVGLITRTEESTEYGVSECDRNASTARSSRPIRGCRVVAKTLLILSSTCIVQGFSKMRDLRFLGRC